VEGVSEETHTDRMHVPCEINSERVAHICTQVIWIFVRFRKESCKIKCACYFYNVSVPLSAYNNSKDVRGFPQFLKANAGIVLGSCDDPFLQYNFQLHLTTRRSTVSLLKASLSNSSERTGKIAERIFMT
jgi:hypothetical protein